MLTGTCSIHAYLVGRFFVALGTYYLDRAFRRPYHRRKVDPCFHRDLEEDIFVEAVQEGTFLEVMCCNMVDIHLVEDIRAWGQVDNVLPFLPLVGFAVLEHHNIH
jgi:hypothetical protein